MSEDLRLKKCPEYCPFLMASGTFCQLFRRTLQSTKGIALKCEECKNPQQRMSSYKALGLSVDNRADMWNKAVHKHNEIELGKKRKEEEIRKKFAAFLEDKFGSHPPLAGNIFLNNLIINLYMVMDTSERSMMMSVLNSRSGDAFIQSIDRSPKDDSLLRNIRRELNEHFSDLQQSMQLSGYQNFNANGK